MSTVLPELERLLDEAAARHYRRRPPPRAVRWTSVAAAVAAVAVAVVLLVPGSRTDERPAADRSVATADDPVGNAYAILAKAAPAPDPALWHELVLPSMYQKRSSSVWRLAREDGGRRIAVSTGRNEVTGKRLVCVHLLNRIGVGAVCEPAAKLLASDRPGSWASGRDRSSSSTTTSRASGWSSPTAPSASSHRETTSPSVAAITPALSAGVEPTAAGAARPSTMPRPSAAAKPETRLARVEGAGGHRGATASASTQQPCLEVGSMSAYRVLIHAVVA
jgi:hypothetical protein